MVVFSEDFVSNEYTLSTLSSWIQGELFHSTSRKAEEVSAKEWRKCSLKFLLLSAAVTVMVLGICV